MTIENKEEVKTDKLTILCPFCNHPWTAKMEEELWLEAAGCDTCGYGREYGFKIEIYCEHCGKKVYVKEGVK